MKLIYLKLIIVYRILYATLFIILIFNTIYLFIHDTQSSIFHYFKIFVILSCYNFVIFIDRILKFELIFVMCINMHMCIMLFT